MMLQEDPFETHWVGVVAAAQDVNTLPLQVIGCARSWRDRNLRKKRTLVAFTLHSFFFTPLPTNFLRQPERYQ